MRENIKDKDKLNDIILKLYQRALEALERVANKDKLCNKQEG